MDRHGIPFAQNRAANYLALVMPYMDRASDAEITSFARTTIDKVNAALGKTYPIKVFKLDHKANAAISEAGRGRVGEILQRLRGTQVKLAMTEGDVTGTVMNVETRPTVYQGSGDKGTVVHNLPWINLLTSKGVRSYNLATSNGFEILDPALAAELNKALEALAEVVKAVAAVLDKALRFQPEDRFADAVALRAALAPHL